MPLIVLDASAAIDLLVGIGAHERIRERIVRRGEDLHAPYLLDVEIVSGLRRLERDGRVTRERAAEALEDLRDLAVRRYPHLGLIERVWQLRHNVTTADAVYIALAEALDAPLITADGRLARAPAHAARVELIAP